MKSPEKSSIFLPSLIAIATAAGILLGLRLARINNNSSLYPENSRNSFLNLEHILQLIQEYYVDTINPEEFLTQGINQMLTRLDPHSSYIPAHEFARMNENLEGNFQGIGVEFRMYNDTMLVTHVIPGSPSEKAGIQNLDRIIQVENIPITGQTISTDSIMSLLRGPAHSKVTIKIFRKSHHTIHTLTLSRDVIPIRSVEAYYMVNPSIGYLKITRFARTTYKEFLQAMENLLSQGMKQLILDLRDNGGGYLNAATDIANEFLPKNQLILFTKGKTYKKENYFSSKNGKYEKLPLIVLINENSASASEILAGCLQDHDRALILGRRSFGKGLVQEQFVLRDGSALRLTVARYYTPSGRSIQKPKKKNYNHYTSQTYQRLYSGELFYKDSIKTFDTVTYYSDCGRKLYGGGGIYPDIFIPLDTQSLSSSSLIATLPLQDFIIYYVEQNLLLYKKNPQALLTQFLHQPNNTWNTLMTFLEKRKINNLPYHALLTYRNDIYQTLTAYLARLLFSQKQAVQFLHKKDPFILKASQILSEIKNGNPCEFPSE